MATRPSILAPLDWYKRRRDRLNGIARPAEAESASAARLRVVGSIALAVAIGVIAQKQLAEELEEKGGLILWGFAVAAFVFGLYQAWTLRGQAAEKEEPLALRTELWLAGAVMAVGLFFAFYKFTSVPPGLNHDASWEGLHAIRITNGMPYSPYVAEAWGRETMFHYFVAFIQLFMGPSRYAIILGSTFIGLATLPVFYLMLRRLFDARLALIGTFLFAVSGWQWTMNRVGWRSSLVPLFYALVFYFLVKALQERKPRDFVLAGIFLGLSLDTYDAARILPFIAGAYLLFEFVRKPSLVRENYVNFGLMGLAAVLAFAPLGWYAFNHWEDYTGRSRFLWIGTQIEEAGSWEPLFINIKNALLMFNFRAGGDDFYTTQPLLDMPMTVFFVLGLVYSITRIRQPGHFLMIAMLVLTMAVGIVSRPNGNRNIGALVPTTVFAAIFLYEAWRWLEAHFPRYKDLVAVGLVGVLVFTAYLTYDDYMGPGKRTQWGFYPETTRVGNYMHGIASDYEIHAAAGNWPRDALTYLTYQGKGDPFENIVYDYTTAAVDLLGIPLSPDRGTAFIIEAMPDNLEVIDTLGRRYPSATVEEIHYPEGVVTAYAVLVPAGASPDASAQPEVAAGAEERDNERRAELLQLAAALTAYRDRTGEFPNTQGNIQTACVYTDLDAACAVQDDVGIETFVDSREDPGNYGYWYSSDGITFTLYASLEGQPTQDEACPASVTSNLRRPNLLCLEAS